MLANHAEVVMHDLAAGQHHRLSPFAAVLLDFAAGQMGCATICRTCRSPSNTNQMRPAVAAWVDCAAAPDQGWIGLHATQRLPGFPAAGLLLELERLMLTIGPTSVSMTTFLDAAPEFQAAIGAASALEAMSNRLYNDDVSWTAYAAVADCTMICK